MKTRPHRLVCARKGSPLLIGLGIEENFIASDASALLPVTQRMMYLEEGDIADIGLLTDQGFRPQRRQERIGPYMSPSSRRTWPNSGPTGISCRRKSTSSRAALTDTLEAAHGAGSHHPGAVRP